MADEVILLPIYPARELPVPGVSSEMILERMKKKDKRVMTKESLLKYIKERWAADAGKGAGQLLITAGAGDIDALVQPLKKIVSYEL